MNSACLYILLFADERVMIVNDKDDMKYMMEKLIEEYNKRVLSVNIKKTKYQCFGKEAYHLIVDNHQKIETSNE